MPFNETWVDKINGVDVVMAEDANQLAHGIIDLESSVAEVKANVGNIEIILSTI